MTLKALSQFDCVLNETKSAVNLNHITVWAKPRMSEEGRYIIEGDRVASSAGVAKGFWGSEGCKFILPRTAEIAWIGSRLGLLKRITIRTKTTRWYAEVDDDP
jgi:hypothetical protein